MRRYTYIADGKGMGGGRTVPIACCRRTGCLRVVIGYARKRAEVLKCSVLMCQQLPHAFCNCEKPENRVCTLEETKKTISLRNRAVRVQHFWVVHNAS